MKRNGSVCSYILWMVLAEFSNIDVLLRVGSTRDALDLHMQTMMISIHVTIQKVMGITSIVEHDFSCITCLHMSRKPHTDVRHCSFGAAMAGEDEAEGKNEYEESDETSS